jgi:hypothetical protein
MSRPPLVIQLALVGLVGLTAACGHKIGDSCTVSSDCSDDGSRVCDTFSPGGSCTIEGCDFGTCPEEAVCVRFFPALPTGAVCTVATQATDCDPDEVCGSGGRCVPSSAACTPDDPTTPEREDTACQPDEICTIGGRCAPRSIELRFCMPTCGGNGDCRDGYECRNKTVMIAHGGEPVPDPTLGSLPANPTAFCAGRKPCTTDADCDVGDRCGRNSRLCEPAPSKPQASFAN